MGSALCGPESVTEHIFHQPLGGWDCPFQLCCVNINLRITFILNHFELSFWLRPSLYVFKLARRSAIKFALSYLSEWEAIPTYIYMFFCIHPHSPLQVRRRTVVWGSRSWWQGSVRFWQQPVSEDIMFCWNMGCNHQFGTPLATGPLELG